MECYKRNRTRVFEIYGIDPKDERYNCHHIVTREDLKIGVVPFNFDINTKSNLYPSIIKDHTNLHKLLNKLEPRPIIQENKIDFQRINLTPIVSVVFDPRIIEMINKPIIRQKSTQLRFLVWRHQGIL